MHKLTIHTKREDFTQRVKNLKQLLSKGDFSITVESLEFIDFILFETDFDVEVKISNGKSVDKERAKRMRLEGFDLR